MYTYTFSKEHFDSIMSHVMGLQMRISSLILNGITYTMVCETPFDTDQYAHLQQSTNLEEIV